MKSDSAGKQARSGRSRTTRPRSPQIPEEKKIVAVAQNQLAKSQAPIPIPVVVAPAELRERVSGGNDLDWFCQSGARTVAEWGTALSIVGRGLKSFERIVDFGCGCGRALRVLKPILDAHQQLIGIDPDKEATDWVKENYEGVIAIKADEIPPLPLKGGSVDLILSHSVFTHLPEDIQHLWIFELGRILQTGGYAVLSFHGERAFTAWTDGLLRVGDAFGAIRYPELLDRDGFLYTRARTDAEKALPGYYGLAFHTINYVQRNWCRSFKLRAWLPSFALDQQDVVVLEKR